MSNWNDVEVPKSIDFSRPVFKDKKTKRIETLFLKALNTEIDSKYRPQIRISKLPCCGLIQAQEEIRYNRGERKKERLADGYYTDIGDAVHLFYQRLLPRSEIKHQVFGNWRCNVCKTLVAERVTTPDSLICPHCKRNEETVEYSEIEVSYRGIDGHIDMIFLVNGRYTMIDFKTTNSFSIKTGRYLPYPKHRMQIESYCFMFYKQFGIEIDDYFIVYVSRDKNDSGENLKNTRPIGYTVTQRMLRRRRDQLIATAEQKRLIKTLLKNPTLETLKALEDIRPCKSRVDYDSTRTGMTHGFFKSECPYIDDNTGDCSCFRTPKWTKASKELWSMLNE